MKKKPNPNTPARGHQRITRRNFLKQSSLMAAGFWLGASHNLFGKVSPNEKLNIGVIGVSNRGSRNLAGVTGENIVALCDVDSRFLDKALQQLPQARRYSDFRKLLEQKDLDAVVVSTADHAHAVATVAALQSGRHVYCEKPLTHTVSEARIVAAAARRHNRVTQMGNQIHSTNHYRRVVELVQTGAIGAVTEVHCWADFPWETKDKPAGVPVPSTLDYESWLGPVQPVPYSPEYHPFNWRRWWHFGGGTIADFCCHLMDLPYWALDLKHPQTVEAQGPPVHPDCAPPWLIVNYEYGARGKLPPVKMTWYSGGKRPPIELPKWGNGVLFIGRKGMLLTDYSKLLLLPENDFQGFIAPQPYIPESPGHHQEWIRACKGQGKTTCHFGYGALLTEAGLLGNVAYRVGKKIQWEARKMRAANCPEADPFIHHDYRAGWKI